MLTKSKEGVERPNTPYDGRVGLVYARVSDKSQETQGSGGKSQETRCIKDLESLEVVYEKSFIDTFTGGGDFMRRPAMRQMLTYIDAYPHKKFLVVFDDLKRFARDVKFHFALKAELVSRDVMLRCLNYNFDDSPEGEFVETLFAAANQLERKQNRRQVIQKMKARLDAGYYPFARKRGYSTDKTPGKCRIRVPNQEGLEILKPALEGFATANLPRKIDMANFLVDRGFWKDRLALRCLDDVTTILNDPFYCGDIEYEPWGVKRMKGQHEGIISPETFTKIQRRLSRDGADLKPRKDTSEDFPLRGLLICDLCGCHLTGSPSRGRTKQYLYYFCQNRKCELYYKSLRKKNIEDDFKELLERNTLKHDVEKLVSLVFDKVWAQESEAIKWHDNLIEQNKIELKKKLKELAEMARKATSDVVIRTYESQIEDTGKELEAIEQLPPVGNDLDVPYRTAFDKSVGLLKNPVSTWDLFDVHGQHELFFFLFEGKLAYSKTQGYRTGDLLSTARLFEEFVNTNSDSVDRTGFEPVASTMP